MTHKIILTEYQTKLHVNGYEQIQSCEASFASTLWFANTLWVNCMRDDLRNYLALNVLASHAVRDKMSDLW